MEVRQYQTPSGQTPFANWLKAVRDKMAQARIVARIERFANGLAGDWKSVGAGVYELRIDVGKGYRVYYAVEGNKLVLLLCGGNKQTQTKDIENAHAYWKDYKSRK